MHANSTLVRSILATAERVVTEVRSRTEQHPGPRLAQSPLGRLMVRGDWGTALSLARDIDPDHGELLAMEIITGWGRQRRESGASRHSLELLEGCDALVSALRRSGLSAEQQKLLRVGAVLYRGAGGPGGGWTRVLPYFPGRTKQWLREDYDIAAQRFYQRHGDLVCRVDELLRGSTVPALMRREAGRQVAADFYS